MVPSKTLSTVHAHSPAIRLKPLSYLTIWVGFIVFDITAFTIPTYVLHFTNLLLDMTERFMHYIYFILSLFTTWTATATSAIPRSDQVFDSQKLIFLFMTAHADT